MDTAEAALSANSNEHECPICLNPFREPKILFCGHVICRLCLITWLRARNLEAGCPLCRHPIFEVTFLDLPLDFVELIADSFPTDEVIKATTRGRINPTPHMCQWCEDLLCSSRDTPHPKCPGPQDERSTHQREADARKTVKDLSDKVELMMETSNDMDKFLNDVVAEIRDLADMNETEDLVQEQTLQFVNWFRFQTGKLRSVLLTHKNVLHRMGDSHQVMATNLMRKPMQDRVEKIRRKLNLLNQSYFRGSQCVRALWRK